MPCGRLSASSTSWRVISALYTAPGGEESGEAPQSTRPPPVRIRHFRDVKVDFAGAEWVLMAKLLAANERGKEKDYYGITYVLLKQRAGGRERDVRSWLAHSSPMTSSS